MGRDEGSKHRSRITGWIDLASFGFSILAFGIIWLITPNFYDEIVNFAKDFRLTNVTEQIVFPAPVNPHPVLYTAIMQLCVAIGVIQITVLALRFAYRESLNRKAGTIGGLGFWFGAALFLNMLTNESLSWFGFIGGLIISIGLSIVLSSLFKLFD